MSGTVRRMRLAGGIAGRFRATPETRALATRRTPGYCRALTVSLIASVIVCLSGCSRLYILGEPKPQQQAGKVERASLSYLGAWGVKGSDPGQLDQPTSIATDQIGNSYIADAGSQFIQKFDARGTPLLAFQDPPLAHPQAIAVDRGGALYVTDASRGSVFVYFPNGDRYRELRLPTRSNAENMAERCG